MLSSKACRAFAAGLVLLALVNVAGAAEIAAEAGATLDNGRPGTYALSVRFGEQKNVGHELQDFVYECGAFAQTSGIVRSNGGLHCLVVDRFSIFELGVGLAYLEHTDEISGSRANFALLARWRMFGPLSLTYRHVSNANLTQPNHGRDMVLLGYSFH